MFRNNKFASILDSANQYRNQIVIWKLAEAKFPWDFGCFYGIEEKND